jgi:cytochrome P450 family 3 subfamily A
MGSDLKSDDVRTQVVSMILGGNETVTSALTSAAYLLAIHPDVQDKLIQEISEYFKGNPESTLNDAIELPYLDMVVSEVLRMYPPFTRTARECEKECVLGGYTIPAGMYIDIPIYYLHHHPAYWTDPYVFNPERFSSENKSKIQPFTYLPFSDGPRNCIGMRFALMEIKMVLIQILRRHKFVRFPDTQVPMRMKNGITLGPNDPVMLGFQSHD